MSKIDKGVSYQAIFKLQKKKNKHPLLVEAGMIGTQKLAHKIELKNYKEQLEINERRKEILDLAESSKIQPELKVLKRKSEGKTLS